MLRFALATALAIQFALGVGSLPTAAEGNAVHPVTHDYPLQESLSAYVNELNAEYGVVAIGLEDGRASFVNADTIFPAASMYKVLVMYRVYEALDGGRLSFDDPVTILGSETIYDEPGGWYSPGEVTTVEQALEVMIAESSNAAAHALTRLVGGWGIVESAADELGMSRTFVEGDQFWTTPNDMAHFFRLLAEWKLISPLASQEMTALLLRQTRNDRIPAMLPEEASVAHKTGELEEVRNDGGIVYAPGGWYVIVTMSKDGAPDEEIGAQGQLSRLVYERFGR